MNDNKGRKGLDREQRELGPDEMVPMQKATQWVRDNISDYTDPSWKNDARHGLWSAFWVSVVLFGGIAAIAFGVEHFWPTLG